jgi:hypothetical protein
MKAADKLRLSQMGDRAQVALRSSLSQEILAAKLCDEVDALLQPAALRSPETQRV